MLTINAAIQKALESSAIEFYANEFAEPGYDTKARGILFANWNDKRHYDNNTRTWVTDDDTMSRLSDLAEKAGYTVEWSDQWTTCNDCGKAVRTEADSYGWKRSYAEIEGDILCHLCVKEDPSAYLESLEGDARRGDTMDLPLEDHGYHKVNTESYQHGWHPGQNDSPEVVAKSLTERGISRFLFRIDDVEQFTLHFSVYVHEDELALLAHAPVKSELPYDPGTEIGKALRGEPTPHYEMKITKLTPEEFVSGVWAKNKDEKKS